VVEIDGRKIGLGRPGPVTARLTKDFHALVRA
jgi:branched-subunit amino acid aminotransferase/4-amino-4-deoxychorismate lyase